MQTQIQEENIQFKIISTSWCSQSDLQPQREDRDKRAAENLEKTFFLSTLTMIAACGDILVEYSTPSKGK